MTHYYFKYFVFSVFVFGSASASAPALLSAALALAAPAQLSPQQSQEDEKKTPTDVSACSAASASSQQQKNEQSSTDDYFDTLKELIVLGPTKKGNAFDDLMDKSNCSRSAKFLLGLVSDGKEISKATYEKRNPNYLDHDYKFRPSSKKCSSSGSDSKAIGNKAPKKLIPPPKPKLVNFDKWFSVILEPSTAPNKQEHLFFHVDLNGGNHAFVLERMSGNGMTTWWRTYQSYFEVYTLKEWLGVCPFTNKITNRHDMPNQRAMPLLGMHDQYGNGIKITTRDGIAHFLNEQLANTFFAASSKNKIQRIEITTFAAKENLRSELQLKLAE